MERGGTIILTISRRYIGGVTMKKVQQEWTGDGRTIVHCDYFSFARYPRGRPTATLRRVRARTPFTFSGLRRSIDPCYFRAAQPRMIYSHTGQSESREDKADVTGQCGFCPD